MLAPLQRKVTSTEGEKNVKMGMRRRPIGGLCLPPKEGVDSPRRQEMVGQKPLRRLPSSVRCAAWQFGSSNSYVICGAKAPYVVGNAVDTIIVTLGQEPG